MMMKLSRRKCRLRSALAGSLLVLLGAAAGLSAERRDSPRPNVIFLFTDDQRPDTIAALGNPVIKTPNLDRLVQSGFVMRNAYCFGSSISAVCLPSRNMMMSGRAYFRWEGRLASGDDPNFPDAMRAAGYETYHHEKNKNNARQINEKFEHWKYVDEDIDRLTGEPGEVFVDEAIAFLKNRSPTRPFFMYLGLSNPHDPRVAAQHYLDLYRRGEVPLPKNYMPLHPFDNGQMAGRDEQLARWPRTEEEIRRHIHDYYAVITGMDFHIGRLLDYLRDSGLEKNTIVIFSSDNGLAIGSHGLMGKQNLYDHSAKVPLIFAGPGIPRGESDALVYLMDIFPTVCELTGASIPAGLDGRSFAQTLRGGRGGGRDTLFMAFRELQRGIRDDRWKLIRYPRINKTQLFDLWSDPDELVDLSSDPAYARRIEHMLAGLRHWQDRLGDTLPLTSETPADPTFTPPTNW